MTNNKFCTECGFKLESNVRFCGLCGVRIPLKRRGTSSEELYSRISDRLSSRTSRYDYDPDRYTRSSALRAAVDLEIAKLNNKSTESWESVTNILENAEQFYNYLKK
tara:strand:- start:38 stop:358 length:321 start_codon:yes stop_codon:yes gene_type:complete